MRAIFIAFLLLFAMSCGNCNPEPLHRVCVEIGYRCYIDNQNKTWVEGDKGFEEATSEFPHDKGVCRWGVVDTCIDDEPRCIQFVSPSKETCDELDNDCDGLIDEDFDRDNDGWTTCKGDCNDSSDQINPDATERCNGFDDTCDGLVDENIAKRSCSFADKSIIVGGDSICSPGEQTCENGKWSLCKNDQWPDKEICDGLDNDCDGQTDEEEGFHCGPLNETGACSFGEVYCGDNGETLCRNAVYSERELCNNADDDCNGIIDDGLERLCETECGYGAETCQMGQWVDCSAPIPVEEVCDGIDNNCNGEVDEDCPCTHGDAQTCKQNIIDPATNTSINCGVGTQICDMGEWGACIYYGTEAEQCNDWDDDCDGNVDGFSESCGDPITAGIGVCQLGTSTCTAGTWTECDGVVVPTEERCNQKDDDCDGLVDEDLNPYDAADICFIIDGSGSMSSILAAVLQGIDNYVLDFIGTNHRFCLVMFPGQGSNNPWELAVPLTDIVSFRNILSTIISNYPGSEPSYDVMYDAASPTDPIGINWRAQTQTSSGAYPYIILITDEQAQTWRSITQINVAGRVSSCQVGLCQPGDAFEVFVITQATFFPQWIQVVFNDPNRLFEILPADPNRYTDILRSVFSNVCIVPGGS